MAGAPLADSKSTWAGAVTRRRLLAAQGIELPGDLGLAGQQVGVDDVLDAAAVAWTARRFAAGCSPLPAARARALQRPDRLRDLGLIQPTGSMRVLGAARLSRKRNESMSKDRQQELIEMWAQLHGHEVVHIARQSNAQRARPGRCGSGSARHDDHGLASAGVHTPQKTRRQNRRSASSRTCSRMVKRPDWVVYAQVILAGQEAGAVTVT